MAGYRPAMQFRRASRKSASMPTSKRTTPLETAERLFYVEVGRATGIDRVVAETGVAPMTLYNHFPSKDAPAGAVCHLRSGGHGAFVPVSPGTE